MKQISQNPTQKKQNKGLRVAKIIGNIIFYIVILSVIAAGILGIVGKLTGKENAIGLFGNNLFVVATPSMAHVNPDYESFLAGHDDRIQVGDLIITRRIKKGEKLHLYDVVTFTEIKDGQNRQYVDSYATYDLSSIYPSGSNQATDYIRLTLSLSKKGSLIPALPIKILGFLPKPEMIKATLGGALT